MQNPGSPARALARALTLALAMAVAGCSGGGGTEPDPPPPDFGGNNPSVVVGLGNSITFGLYDTWVATCDESLRGWGGYCPRLAQRTGKTVVNEGICGEKSYDGVDRIGTVLSRHRPGVILIDYGANDLIWGTPGIIENLRYMITAARNNHTVPMLGTLIPAAGDSAFLNPGIEATNAGILALCKAEGIECADHWRAFTSHPTFKTNPGALLSEDGLHPNAAGYQLMASTWRQPLMRIY